MGKTAIKKGTIIHPARTICNKLEIVISGSVKAYDAFKSYTITSGGIIGVLETANTSYEYTYEAIDDVVLFDYSYNKYSDIERVLVSNAKILPNLVQASIRTYLEAYQIYQKNTYDAKRMYKFIQDSYSEYIDLCTKFKVPQQALASFDEIADFSTEEEIHTWEVQYFNSIRGLDADTKKLIFAASAHLGVGVAMEAIHATARIFNMCSAVADYLIELSSCVMSEGSGDFFDLYSNLVLRASSNPFSDTTSIEAAVSKLIIFLQDSPYLDIGLLHEKVSAYRKQLQDIEEMLLSDEGDVVASKDAYEDLDKSLETIFDFARVEVEDRERFRDLIERYKLMPDKNATDDAARRLRKSISDDFYMIYEKAFIESLTNKSIPIAVRMFFYFGYMDEELAGINNASILHEFVQKMEKDPEGRVLTFYDWLMLIYNGKAEPSKNEFDMDYPAFIREQKSLGNINEQEEYNMQHNPQYKVCYEIANMFKVVNKITFGRITTFCPVLSEHNILRPLQSILATPKVVYEAIDAVREVDFSCYYRDVLYTNPAVGIQMEYVAKEVLPHIILMPNVGTRGSLWQETANSRKDSMGRIMVSIFPMENLTDMIIRLSGEFRWELCKRIQGVRWNDVTDPSLTAEYCDYVQFYRKNHELSTDAKEKLKLQLQKAKNNYREVFVQDYVQWIKYEGHGSPRLNRYARAIMYRYCPFAKAIRDSVASNPMYSPLLEKAEIKKAQKLHTMDLLFQKIQNLGQPIPQELKDQRAFMDM